MDFPGPRAFGSSMVRPASNPRSRAMFSNLLAAAHNFLIGADPSGLTPGQVGLFVAGAFVIICAGILLVIFFSFLRLWVQCLLTGAQISILDLIGMKLRNVDYPMIVRQKIALVQANVKISTRDLEAHYLSRGNV